MIRRPPKMIRNRIIKQNPISLRSQQMRPRIAKLLANKKTQKHNKNYLKKI